MRERLDRASNVIPDLCDSVEDLVSQVSSQEIKKDLREIKEVLQAVQKALQEMRGLAYNMQAKVAGLEKQESEEEDRGRHTWLHRRRWS